MIKREQTLKNGKWYDTDGGFIHICCKCRARHNVDFKLSKTGKLKMRWRIPRKPKK